MEIGLACLKFGGVGTVWDRGRKPGKGTLPQITEDEVKDKERLNHLPPGQYLAFRIL